MTAEEFGAITAGLGLNLHIIKIDIPHVFGTMPIWTAMLPEIRDYDQARRFFLQRLNIRDGSIVYIKDVDDIDNAGMSIPTVRLLAFDEVSHALLKMYIEEYE